MCWKQRGKKEEGRKKAELFFRSLVGAARAATRFSRRNMRLCIGCRLEQGWSVRVAVPAVLPVDLCIDSESVASGGQIAVCASPADRLFLKRVTLICHMELHLSLLIKLTTLCVRLQLLQQIVNKPPRQNSINLSDSRIRVKLALCSRAHGCALCRGLVVASRRGTHAHGLPSHSAPGPIPSHPIYCCGLLTEYSLSLSSPS